MEGPVSGRKIKRRTIRTLIIFAVIIIIMISAIAGIGYFSKQVTQKKQQERQAGLEATVRQLAVDVSDSFNGVINQLDNLVKDQKLHEFLSRQDIEQLKHLADDNARKIPNALKLRIFLPGQYQEDRESSPPLGFASLALLSDAEKQPGKPDIEVHGFNSPDAHIVIIRRVADAEGKLLGLVHLSLKPDPFIVLEDKSGLAGGYAELVQKTGQTPLLLSKSGNAGARQGAPVSAPVKGTRWRIDYWPKSSASKLTETDNNQLSPLIYIVAILAVALIAIIFIFFRRKLSQKEDVPLESGGKPVVYAGAVKAIMEGQHPGLEKLIPNLPNLGLKKPVKPVSQGLEGDDITKIAKAPAAKPDQGKPAPVAPAKKPPPVAPSSPAVTTADADEKPSTTPAGKNETNGTPGEIPVDIFRAYDIRGIVGKTLTAEGVTRIGRAIGSEAKDRGQTRIAVGHDGRISSPELSDALIRGLQSSGIDVIDIGMAPTPVLYFATFHLETNSGVMVTGSHNGPEYNGLKIVLGGETLASEAIQSIRQRIETDNFTSGQGGLQTSDITADYIRRATEDIPVALGGAFKIVVDCGNGVAGGIAPQLYRALGHDVVEMFCEIDGKFPNHHPDPSQPDNLQDLIGKVKETGADIGFAFDGDGDRLGIVDGTGNIIWPDRQMMLFARDVLGRNQGAQIIYDVKCSSHLKTIIESAGGQPLMWKTGHSLIKSKMKELDAPLAGEMSGHIFFKERWYGFDDAIYTGARMLEILSQSKMKPAEVFAELPGGVATPELRIPLAEKHHAKFIQALLKKAAMLKKTVFENARFTDIDGLRIDLPKGWGLIRPSNTSPYLIARFEADDEETLKKIQNDFRELINTITPDLKLPF